MIDVHVDVDSECIVLVELRERGGLRNWGHTADGNYYRICKYYLNETLSRFKITVTGQK